MDTVPGYLGVRRSRHIRNWCIWFPVDLNIIALLFEINRPNERDQGLYLHASVSWQKTPGSQVTLNDANTKLVTCVRRLKSLVGPIQMSREENADQLFFPMDSDCRGALRGEDERDVAAPARSVAFLWPSLRNE